MKITRLLAMVVAFAWLLTPSVAAYIGTNPYNVRLNGPSGTVSCSKDVVITATVRDTSTNRAVSHQTVNWAVKQSPSSGDRLSHSSSSTGSDGKASVTLSFGSPQGSRSIRATVAAFGVNLVVKCAGATGPVNNPTPRPPTVHKPNPTPAPAKHPNTLPVTSTALAASAPVDSSGSTTALLLTLVFISGALVVYLRRSLQR